MIVPHISSVAEAEAVVRAARFPPLGVRSAVAGLPREYWDVRYTCFDTPTNNEPLADYSYAHLPTPVANEICNSGTLVIVMIEDQAGLDCVE